MSTEHTNEIVSRISEPDFVSFILWFNSRLTVVTVWPTQFTIYDIATNDRRTFHDMDLLDAPDLKDIHDLMQYVAANA